MAESVEFQPGYPVNFRDLSCTKQDGSSTYVVHTDVDGSGLQQSVLTVAGGAYASRTVDAGCDEVLYVLAGAGEATVDGMSHRLQPGVAVRFAGESIYMLQGTGAVELEVLIVCGPAVSMTSPTKSEKVDGADRQAHEAVGSREFRVLFDHNSGCSGMTQFLGYVPKVRTARHVHPYSEMLCIVQGSGTVEIAGRTAAVGVGSCYYLPAGVPHRVENTDEEFLVELGVFTPSGSPAQNTPVDQ